MIGQTKYLSNLKSITENYGDYRGAMLLPPGVLFLVLGAKLLFSTFDPAVVDNPSLFDASGNIYWDTASIIAHISILSMILIHYWYKAKIGIVVAKREQKDLELIIGSLVALISAVSILLDYNFTALFSFTGITVCGMWLIGFFKHPNLKMLYSVNLFIQVAVLVAGPILFADLRSDMLNYQRHIVGICMFTAGALLIVSGFIIHSYLMEQLKKNRPFYQND